ncbi:MAG: T9SS type A sorting domain-containing protein [Saprospiraceae bacterium]|nr:T9SS type A sorting domain-containing protein [Candidatus Opimibacter iunctus]
MRPESFVIIFLLSFAPKMIQGQYIPMVEEGKYWIYLNYYISGDHLLPVSGHAITFEGDTIINSLSYKKVYKHLLKGGHPCMYPPCWEFTYPYQTESKSVISFIREDTLEKQIYNLPLLNWEFCDTAEHLIFDYSLGIGDTVNSCIYDFILAGLITETPAGIVDSIGARDLFGKSRNTIFTTGYLPYGQDYFIQPISIVEGVGLELAGIFFNPLSVLIDFCEGGINPCQLLSSNFGIENPKPINIFPNPTKGILHVSSEEVEIKSIRIYSTMGLFLAEFPITNSIDISNLEKGIYFLELISKSNERIVKKIAKQN